ncbi:MAG: 4Fe-4S dicluster domain-containing protein [Bdellovibrionota bacterium]
MTDNDENEKKRENYLSKFDLEVTPGVGRRKFLGLMGASMALAGAATSGCIRRPKEYIYPDNERPENTLPGVPKNYSTTALIGSTVLGLSVTSTDGRPTKIDGNSRHPTSNPIPQSNIGSSNAFAQAEILNLYDPERGQHCVKNGKNISKQDALTQIKNLVTLTKNEQGKGLAFAYESCASPAFAGQLNQFQKMYPKALFVEQDTTYSGNRLEGLSLVTDQNVDVAYNLSKANVILSADSDFLSLEGDSVKYARQFAESRRVLNEYSTMNRLYCVESNMSLTGSNADHRYTMHSNLIGDFLLLLLKELNLNSIKLPSGFEIPLFPKTSFNDKFKKWVKALAKDLASQAGHGVVIVGDKQPQWVHALGFAINCALGAVSSEIVALVPVKTRPVFVKNMSALVEEIQHNAVQTLIMIGGNPAYAQPADFGFSKALAKVTNSVYLGLFPDETAKLSTYYVPQTHFLESWGDMLSTEGISSVRQPLIAPLFDECVNEYEFVSHLIDEKPLSDYDIVRSIFGNSFTEGQWRQHLSDGVLKDSLKYQQTEFKFNFSHISSYYEKNIVFAEPTAQKLNIDFVLDSSLYDGRYANNAWLQELSNPIHKLVWDNAFFMSPKTAKALGLNGKPKPGKSAVDVIKVTYNKRVLEAAVWEVPGIADFTLVLSLGYGRSFGKVSQGSGFNANLIRTSNAWTGNNVIVEKTGKTYSLVSTQEHSSMSGTPKLKEDRPPVIRETTFENFKKKPAFVLNYELLDVKEQKSNLFPYPSNPTQAKWSWQQWGMTIDLTTCIGCNACTVACQAENNISVVGKEEIFKNREMSWIRIDRYFEGNVDAPEVRTAFQPMNCQHCENAPCEAVCPVAATTHSPDGLNDMAYNRCVGTRYCANNCPYKVRRYNFFNYSKIDDERNPLYAMQKNPNVTVRFRGVMEKCTYCVHKINAAKIKANQISSMGIVPDGGIVTACQSACPTNSIVFGDVADPKSKVSKLKATARNYSLLGELNTRPRTTYLAKLRNVNPEIG